jgi:UDP-N-acetylglucosamine/UDP-N-acetylgalactosamine diphosphorylase
VSGIAADPDLRARLEAAGQGHLLRFMDRLDAAGRDRLLEDIAALDLDLLATLRDGSGPIAAGAAVPADLDPPAVVGLEDAAARAEARDAGESMIREGRVAAFTVAGGQGTRLGWRGPKGTFPATPVTGKPLFRVFAEQILATQRRYGVVIPWYIMTSPENDSDTRAFLLDNNCFGLERRHIMLMPQGVMPSVDDAGRILLAAPDRVAVNPDGHGGSLRVLRSSAALEDMRGRGIEQISYFQVDNPSVRAIDPVFLGLHAAHPGSSGEMSSKIVRKTDPAEKVGVFARSGDRTMVVEYSDLPAELAEARADDGSLRFDAGSIAIHVLSVDFVERITGDDGPRLPFHMARKKVPHVDLETGEPVEPAEPNATKFELFIFDAIPLARRSLVVETDRVAEFAPIKNASGSDSPSTSHRLQSERAARWLEARGVAVPREADGRVAALLEIGALTAMEPEHLEEPDLAGLRIRAGEATVL